MGADVIKVETPDGDPNRQNGPSRNPNMAAMHLNMNRNKRSVTLNLKRPEAREALLRLVEEADVFVHSMRPAAAERLGIGYDEIAERNPRIIYGYGCGYLPGGPRENDPAFDDVVQGEAGIADLMLQSVGVARYLPTVIVDKFCGYMLASAIGMALYARERTGRGQLVRVPMLETIVAFNLQEHLWGAAFDPPLGTRHRLCAAAVRAPPPLRDAGRLHLRAGRQRRAVEAAAAGHRPARAAGRRALLARVDGAHPAHRRGLRRRVRPDEDADHRRNGASCSMRSTFRTARWRSFQDLLADPYLNETGFFQRYEHPSEGPMLTTAVPTQFSDTPAGPAPAAAAAGRAQRRSARCVWLQRPGNRRRLTR